ncbi:pyridoxal phosphate-dependent aminotransferase [Synergistaceae bacterium OttesenSCG-928-D05]|nr:pyridoxal phosphate-dependent aminotransferase [Synergistaceae bacterium OttesenSCG-928-D05]
MWDFEKSTKLNNVSYDVRGPIVDEADRMREQGIDIMMLNTGDPAHFGICAPDELLRDLREKILSAEGYSQSKGQLAARRAIMEYCGMKNIPGVTENDIFTGNGVSEMIMISMQALLNDGDEILVPMPDYPLWTAAVRMTGGKAVHYLCDEQSEWFPDIADMKKKITDRTKGIVIINPNNPTGALYPRALLEQIVELARQNGLILFSDEIYDRLVMDGLEHVSTASLAPDLPVVTMNGLSKSHRIPGFRCGWMCIGGDKSRVRGYVEGINMLASMRLCSNVLSQAIIPEALKHYNAADPLLVPGGRFYDQREAITEALNAIPGVSAVKPKAAFYIFPKLDMKKFNLTDDERFAVDFLKQQHVMIVHGRGFNWKDPDHFRIVYLPNVEELKDVAHRLEVFLSGYRQ